MEELSYFDSAPMFIASWDENFIPLKINRRTLEIYGLETMEDFISKGFDLLPPTQPDGVPTRDYWYRNLKLAFENGSATFEFVIRRAMEEIVYTEVTAVRSEINGRLVVITYGNDVTKLRRTQILSQISHEIRMPITAMLGISEIQMQDRNLPLEAGEAFSKIHSSGKALLKLVDEALDMSKIEAGKMELINERYEVASLVSDVAQVNLVYIGNNKQINLIVDIDENIPAYLIGDELRVRQILNNLLSNAIKYTDAGSVRLEMRLAEASGGPGFINLVVTIRDTGCGMSQAQVDSLFAYRFSRGMGLGMPITYNLLKLMNATVRVKSEEGMGTEITVVLPQKTGSEETLGADNSRNLKNFNVSALSKIHKLSFKPEPMPYGRVLVVDDVEINLYVAKGLMGLYLLEVDTAESGFAALNKLKQGEVYDIVFMDQMMPEMDGIEATKLIRDLGYEQPIVALTANVVMEQAAGLKDVGFSGYLTKPIDINLLNNCLIRFIRDKQPQKILDAVAEMDLSAKPADHSRHLIDSFLRDAKRAMGTLTDILQNLNEENIKLYTINTHAMKSALANIGETGLSEFASVLEQAGRVNNTAVIRTRTGQFLERLKGVVESITPEEEPETADEDTAFLKEHLLTILTACEEFKQSAAKKAMRSLEEKTWTKQTKTTLSELSEYLLHADFEQAALLARETAELL
ncbi:MAG: ATP-binding protein [Defluviitaleaceae bacterium]|nr:ATP-binding protein [Defluviitaleaceae bacterium]